MAFAHEHGIEPQNVFFSIDVWAQNENGLGRRRTTHPEQGGGGTNIGVAVAKLAGIEFSAGIFAPAWTYEHFPQHGATLKKAIWDGTDIPGGLNCSCPNGLQKNHPNNKDSPVIHSGCSHPAGSSHFFFTDFARPFDTHSNAASNLLYDGKKLHSQLAAQATIPSCH